MTVIWVGVEWRVKERYRDTETKRRTMCKRGRVNMKQPKETAKQRQTETDSDRQRLRKSGPIQIQTGIERDRDRKRQIERNEIKNSCQGKNLFYAKW